MLNKEVTCIICNKTVPMDNMRADKSARGWICMACYEKQSYKKPLKSIEKDYRTIGLTKKELEKPELDPRKQQTKQNYRCALCKFISKQASATALCPNCGKRDILVRIQNTDELLKELEINPL